MTIYVPVQAILIGLGIYMLIGLVLCPVLVKVQSRFIASASRERSMWQGVRPFRAFAISALVWPVMSFFTAKTEIEYRKKGYL